MDFQSMLKQFRQTTNALQQQQSPQNNNNNNNISSTQKSTSSSSPPTSSSLPKKRPLSPKPPPSPPPPPTPTTPIRTIYLLCPPPHKIQTGGPEAMHQLCHKINTLPNNNNNNNNNNNAKITARMVYISPPHDFIPTSTSCPIYSHYNAPYSLDIIDDDASNFVIFPEIWTRFISSCEMKKMLFQQNSSSSSNNNAVRVGIWWLSVDNADHFREWDRRRDIYHFYQSEYARRFLETKNVSVEKIYKMTEFIPKNRWAETTTADSSSHHNDTTTTPSPPSSSSSSRDVDVVYNPVKGMHYTDEIMRRCGKTISFTPIGGATRLNPTQVVQLLRRSKVYIDFGPHPGMDRLPREAALCGCVVVTNREGAAQFWEDVPILERYKIGKGGGGGGGGGSFDVEKVYKVLRDVLANFEERVKDFEGYREWIRGQEGKMEHCVENFLNVLGNEGGDEGGSDNLKKEKEEEDEDEETKTEGVTNGTGNGETKKEDDDEEREDDGDIQKTAKRLKTAE